MVGATEYYYCFLPTLPEQLLQPMRGRLDSVDWNGGLEQWNGMEWWNA